MAQPQPDPSPQSPREALIGGHFAVDGQRPLGAAGGGLSAFAATDRRSGRTDLMAVQVPPGSTPRAQALNVLSLGTHDGVLTPLAHGPAPLPGGAQAWFVICRTPSGLPLWTPGAAAQRPWSEAELVDCLLRPGAEALEWLGSRHVTHRAIRPDNLFRAGPGQPVTLGCAWAAPAAQHQPAIFEPPYAAMCLPAGRGSGSIADDVYALGVVLLALALGRMPLAGLDEGAVIRRKLELGSYAALAGDARLPPAISDLVRGMLAEDPDHRPAPLLLGDPASARSRRVAARPPRRAQQPLAMPSGPAWNARTLAYAVARDPEQGARLARSGEIDRWLRRSVGDAALAVRLDEAARHGRDDTGDDDTRADAMLGMRIVALLDPLAPLAWQGLVFWPDGLGPALIGADPARHSHFGNLIDAEAMTVWASLRPERSDPAHMANEAHQLRSAWQARGLGAGASRLRYQLNPLLPCASPLLAGRMVVRLPDLLPALEAVGASAEQRRVLPVDSEIAAFLAARQERNTEGQRGATQATALGHLRLLARLQQHQRIVSLPNLAAWLAGHAAPGLTQWRNQARREARAAGFAEATRLGRLGDMLAMLDDPDTLRADAIGAREAAAAARAIDQELGRLAAAAPARVQAARRLGQDSVLGLGMSAVAIAAIAALLG
jgi:hypothetical protein